MNNEYERLAEKKVSSEEIFNGRILHVFNDDVKLVNGSVVGREVIRHIGAVCMIPITDDGNVILERQYRYPIDQVITEIPAGKLDSPDEDRLDAAKRELKEETGYTARNWVDLGLFYCAAAYSDEKITMYLATGLEKGEQKLDEDEFLDIFEMPLDEAIKLVMDGEITDAKTQAGLLKAKMYLSNK